MNHSRLVIIGGPKTGKTTLSIAAALLAVPGMETPVIRHTDETKDMEWSKASELVSSWFDAPGPWLVEGVSTARALRKWMAAHPEGKPCDEVIVLVQTHGDLLKGQASMGKGVTKVFEEIREELVKRGVAIAEGMPELPADVLELAIAEAATMKAAAPTPEAVHEEVAAAPREVARSTADEVQPSETMRLARGEAKPKAAAAATPRATPAVSDTIGRMKDPAQMSVEEIAESNAAKAKAAEDAALAAAQPPTPAQVDAPPGDKRAKQWWKDRPWKKKTGA